MPASSHHSSGRHQRAQAGDAEADERQLVGREARGGHASARGARPACAVTSRRGVADVGFGVRGMACCHRVSSAIPSIACSRSWKRLERFPRQRADDLAARSTRLHQAGHPQPAQVPRDQRLRQVHEVDQLRHRGRRLGEALEDAQPRGVGQCLVHDGRLAEVLRRGGDGRDRGADAGGAGHEDRRGSSFGAAVQRPFI